MRSQSHSPSRFGGTKKERRTISVHRYSTLSNAFIQSKTFKPYNWYKNTEYHICRNKRPERLIFRGNKKHFTTHQNPSVLCTPPFEKSLFLMGVYFGKYGDFFWKIKLNFQIKHWMTSRHKWRSDTQAADFPSKSSGARAVFMAMKKNNGRELVVVGRRFDGVTKEKEEKPFWWLEKKKKEKRKKRKGTREMEKEKWKKSK